ncbi:MAG: trehalose-phosphatase, partial [Chloroflexi bacterium]|nr:trehalose-phosphatase [Chloroflexota bacterium]
LLGRLAREQRIQVAVVSGRSLEQLRRLVPVKGIHLAGNYGVEILGGDGKPVEQADYRQVRPPLEALKPEWRRLAASAPGFYLEDKGWALAIHARFASPQAAEQVLAEGRLSAEKTLSSGSFRLLGGDRFLEICLEIADKGKTVAYMLDRLMPAQALPLYLGDDDKDASAFPIVHQRGGFAILVGSRLPETQADWRLASPQEVREWLGKLPNSMDLGDLGSSV